MSITDPIVLLIGVIYCRIQKLLFWEQLGRQKGQARSVAVLRLKKQCSAYPSWIHSTFFCKMRQLTLRYNHMLRCIHLYTSMMLYCVHLNLPSRTYYVYITYCQYRFTMDIQTTMAVYKTTVMGSTVATTHFSLLGRTLCNCSSTMTWRYVTLWGLNEPSTS